MRENIRNVFSEKKGKKQYMHRVVMGKGSTATGFGFATYKSFMSGKYLWSGFAVTFDYLLSDLRCTQPNEHKLMPFKYVVCAAFR